jgi:NTE family protein
MNKNQREILVSCLTQVFGRVEDSFVDSVVPFLRWIEIAGGETLIKEGDEEIGVYFVISGRLRASVTDDGQPRPTGEIARGETVGEISVLTGEPHAATVTAIRDSLLAYADRAAFEELWRQHPEIPVHMARVVINRTKRSAERKRASRPATICLAAVTGGVDLHELGGRLLALLDRWGVATMETSSSITERFGAGAAEAGHDDSDLHHKVTMWLDDVEFWNDYLLLVADDGDSEWTRRCLRHADEVLLFGRADAPVALHPLEERLCMGERSVTGARQVLVLLHDEGLARPSGTAAWLDRRPVDTHLHIRPSLPRDMARLARIVSGNAIGLVLGGGGARGFAHLGVLQALEEVGVPIDMIGGTSIGAPIALLPAQGRSAAEALEIVAHGFRSLLDYTPPVASFLAGRRITATIERHAASWDIEDLWLPYFCMSTSLTTARAVAHERGNLARAVRASVSIPGVLVPVSDNNELLVDGGVLNNLPMDVMREMNPFGTVIAIDVVSPRGIPARAAYRPSVSGWRLLLDRILPGGKAKRVPGIAATILQSTIVGASLARRQMLKDKLADLYLNIHVRGVSLLDFKKVRDVAAIGYRDSIGPLRKWLEETGPLE